MPDYCAIDTSLLTMPQYGMLDIFAQSLFITLLFLADEQGRLQAHPAWVRSKGYPYQDISLETIESGLKTLEQAKLISRFAEADTNTPWIQVAFWWDEQGRMHRAQQENVR